MNSPPTCHGPGCKRTDLIDAHIIPRSFSRLIRSPISVNVTLTMDRTSQRNPLGVFDSKILCSSCDGYLNTHNDQPAFDFIKSFRLTRDNVNMRKTKFFKLGVDCDMLCGFSLSVLWRASISSRPECSLTLGPYEDEARDVLFGLKPLSGFVEFELMVQRYRSLSIDANKLCIFPERAIFGDLNAYGFTLAGLRVFAKIDKRPLPYFCKPYILNGKNVLRGLFTDFENTLEFRRAIEMVVNAEHRRPGENHAILKTPLHSDLIEKLPALAAQFLPNSEGASATERLEWRVHGNID